MSNKINKMITQEIIKKLENVDVNDFEKPWFNIGLSPFNAITKKSYRGVNYITLGGNDYKSKAYASFKQWSSKNCKIKKGEKSHLAVFWKIGKYEDEENGEEKTTFLLRYYRVFNSEQVEGDYARNIENNKLRELENHNPIPCAENLVNNYLLSQELEVKLSDRASFVHSNLGKEYINMPQLGQFKDAASYYATFFHEMSHSTGTSNRLNRDMSGSFGSEKYAKEELVAELGAAMLSGSIGLTQSPRIDHVQYIKSWINCLRNDERFIISAASQAQKSVDFIQESAATYQDFIAQEKRVNTK